MVPAAFHAGAQDILLIAFGLAFRSFGHRAVPIGIDVEGHGRDEEMPATATLSVARWAGSPRSIRWRWSLGKISREQVVPGTPRWAR